VAPLRFFAASLSAASSPRFRQAIRRSAERAPSRASLGSDSGGRTATARPASNGGRLCTSPVDQRDELRRGSRGGAGQRASNRGRFQRARRRPDQREPCLRATWTMVPHHGSVSSSSAGFLDTAKPAVAAAQAGYRNRFGHPIPRWSRVTPRAVSTLCGPIMRAPRSGGLLRTVACSPRLARHRGALRAQPPGAGILHGPSKAKRSRGRRGVSRAAFRDAVDRRTGVHLARLARHCVGGRRSKTRNIRPRDEHAV